jgi:hypothetical protein
LKQAVSVSPVGVIAIAAALGVVGGIGLSLHRQAVQQREVEAIQRLDAQDAEPEVIQVEGPGKPLQSGRVHLTAVEGLPQYPNAFVRPLTSSGKDGGVEMNIAWFSTKDSMDDVLNFYAMELNAKGKRWVVHEFSPTSGYAAYLDLHDHRLHMVSVMVERHETLVFASSSYPERMIKQGTGEAETPPPGLPAVAGAEGSLSFDLGTGMGPAKKLWTSTFKQRTIADVRDTYRKALTDEGWAVQEGKGSSASEARLDAKRGSGELQVMIRRDAASNVAVYVSMSGA